MPIPMVSKRAVPIRIVRAWRGEGLMATADMSWQSLACGTARDGKLLAWIVRRPAARLFVSDRMRQWKISRRRARGVRPAGALHYRHQIPRTFGRVVL